MLVDFSGSESSVECLNPSDEPFRFADLTVDEGRNAVLAVREDHSAGAASETVVNTVCRIAMDGSGDTEVLLEGRDFYQSPRLSPDGSKICYVSWDHPYMPWDNTELWATQNLHTVDVIAFGQKK